MPNTPPPITAMAAITATAIFTPENPAPATVAVFAVPEAFAACTVPFGSVDEGEFTFCRMFCRIPAFGISAAYAFCPRSSHNRNGIGARP